MNIHSIFEYSFKYSILISWCIGYSFGYLFHGFLLKYSLESLLNMEYSFPFRYILKDIHQINTGYPGYSHEYSFFILNISLVILDIHMNIHFWFWISLLEKEYSRLFLDIPDAPDLSLPCGRPDCFAMLPSATFPRS